LLHSHDLSQLVTMVQTQLYIGLSNKQRFKVILIAGFSL